MKRISLNKVMAKLADQPQKVELSLMGDLRKEFDTHEELFKRYQKDRKDFKSVGDEFNDLVGKLQNLYPTVAKSFDRLKDIDNDLKSNEVRMGRLYVDLVNKADELGMEVPNEINKKVLKVEKETKEALGYLKSLPAKITSNISLR
jgi:methyl-accepting chemotaxis protein